METVCLKCGNRGFPETFVFCDECQACALHRYCLDGPVVFHDDVSWYCEDCEVKLVVPSSHDQPTPLLSETSNIVKLANDAIQASGELKHSNDRVKISKQKPQKKKTKEKRKKAVKKKANVPLSDSHSSPELEIRQCSISREEESACKNKSGPVPRDASNSNEEAKPNQVSQVTTEDDSSCAESDCHADAVPIVDPIWKGSLYFCNKTIGTVSGLLAHMSHLANSRVMKETQLFPEVLRADLLPRSMVWPKSFKNEGPTDQSIALYFFPNERSEKVFDMLVDDMIRLELAIRVVAENAELLIFPSTVLPVQHRRIQAKYYLWGVFKGKQTSQGTNDAECGENADFHKLLTWHKHSQIL